jgi:hypothetical protein
MSEKNGEAPDVGAVLQKICARLDVIRKEAARFVTTKPGFRILDLFARFVFILNTFDLSRSCKIARGELGTPYRGRKTS